jgi:hypothetical protein
MSFDKESEEEFKLLKLVNNNETDIYFKILSALNDEKKEQVRFMAFMDKACLNYIKANSQLIPKVESHKFDRNHIISMIGDPVKKELNNKIEQLKLLLRNLIKTYGKEMAQEIACHYEYIYIMDNPSDDIKQYYNDNKGDIKCKDFNEYMLYCNLRAPIENIVNDINKIMYDNNFITINENYKDSIYINFSNKRIALRYESDYVELSKPIANENNEIVIESFEAE